MLPLVHFLAFLAYSYLAVFIYTKNPRSTLNRFTSFLLLFLSIWCLGQIVVDVPSHPESLARFFDNISAIGYVCFSSVTLWLALIFTQKTKILAKKWPSLILIGVPLVLLYL